MTSWQIIAAVASLLAIALSFDKKHYQLLATDASKQHLLLGISTALALLWSLKASIYPGLNIHFLWLTAASLLLGPHLAMLAGLLALAATYIFADFAVQAGGQEALIRNWHNIGIDALTTVTIPSLISYGVYALAYHKLPRHFFVYTFVCAFFAGALAIAAKMFSLASLLWLSGQYSWDILVDNLLILTPLVLFPEAMLNGMTMTVLVVYMPNWVRSFFDEEYLNK